MFRWWKERQRAIGERIISEMDPWTLACAVGARNGSTSSAFGYESWLRISWKNWVPRLQARLPGLRDGEIKRALGDFVERHAHMPYAWVLRQENEKRGRADSVVLGPGESITITIGAA